MRRKVIEQAFVDIQEEARKKIVAAPVHSFFIGVVLGVALVWFNRLLIPLLLLGVLVTLGLWLFGEKEDPFAGQRDAVPDQPNQGAGNETVIRLESEVEEQKVHVNSERGDRN